MGCLFCNIVEGKIPAEIVAETEDAIAFRDIHPQAPVHVLVIPRRHIGSLSSAAPEDEALIGKLLVLARRVAHDQGLEHDGWRLVANTGPHAGQSVPHVHFHVLGGRQLVWPPG